MVVGIALAIGGTAYSAWTDIRTGYVEDWLSHAMIVAGIVLVLFTLPTTDAAAWTLAIGGMVFAAGFAAYSFGQMGGGDVKLFTAIALLVPQQPQLSQLFGIQPAAAIYPFIVSVFVLSGIIYMYVIPLEFLRRIFSKRNLVGGFRKKIQKGIIYAFLLAPVFVFWAHISAGFLFLAFPMAATMMLAPFKDDAVRLFFAKPKLVSRLDDEDVLALEAMRPHVKKKLGLWRKTFTMRELESIRKRARQHGIGKVMVCENLPKFVPYMFASLIITSIFGDFMMWLVLNI
ncbi:prepilin peptidase [Candidatus Micrarchaeota archaeon]|nr:prepilin peptidase [Candidatus Micrarchaeota archaeon]